MVETSDDADRPGTPRGSTAFSGICRLASTSASALTTSTGDLPLAAPVQYSGRLAHPTRPPQPIQGPALTDATHFPSQVRSVTPPPGIGASSESSRVTSSRPLRGTVHAPMATCRTAPSRTAPGLHRRDRAPQHSPPSASLEWPSTVHTCQPVRPHCVPIRTTAPPRLQDPNERSATRIATNGSESSRWLATGSRLVHTNRAPTMISWCRPRRIEGVHGHECPNAPCACVGESWCSAGGEWFRVDRFAR